jgi:diguanylate cyclase
MDIQSLARIDVSLTLVLAIMVTLAYVFGTLARRRNAVTSEALHRLERDLSRANMALNELGDVLCTVRNSTTEHFSRVKRFQKRIAKLSSQQDAVVWHKLCREVEGILDPTLQLVSEIAHAQERIRYQSNYLMTFSESRTDSLTGLGNRRALDYMLSTHLSLLKHHGTPFSLAVIDIDNFKTINDERGHLHGDQMLRDLTELLTNTARSVDILARYGGDEFVIAMPQTDIEGAYILAERLREKVEREIPLTISIGVTSATDADTPETLFHRGDAALYCAKTEGRNRTYCERNLTVEHDASSGACCGAMAASTADQSELA